MCRYRYYTVMRDVCAPKHLRLQMVQFAEFERDMIYRYYRRRSTACGRPLSPSRFLYQAL